MRLEFVRPHNTIESDILNEDTEPNPHYPPVAPSEHKRKLVYPEWTQVTPNPFPNFKPIPKQG